MVPKYTESIREHKLPDPIRLFQLGLLAAPVKTLVLTGPALGIFRTVGLDMSWPSAMRLYEWRCEYLEYCFQDKSKHR